METATQEVRDKKSTEDDDVPGDVLQLLVEDGRRLMTQLINNIYIKLASGPRILLKFQ